LIKIKKTLKNLKTQWLNSFVSKESVFKTLSLNYFISSTF
ncbi:hypothetical protein HMPREF1431_00354, partial [Helicobacter pylori GAMchJs106B]